MSEFDLSNKHFELAVGLSTESIKALLLINSGAAAALIALTDKTGAKHDYSQAIIIFGFGAILSVLTFMLGYLSQLSYANSRLSSELSDRHTSEKNHRRHLIWNTAAILAGVMALIAGSIGMWVAYAEARSDAQPPKVAQPAKCSNSKAFLPSVVAPKMHREKTG